MSEVQTAGQQALSRRRALISLGVMASAAAAAAALTPTRRMAQERPMTALDQALPEQFGDWRIDRYSVGLVSPQVERELASLYTQNLSRTYQDAAGYRIMLSVAYGDDQSRAMQVHRPEVCYPAQGFQVLRLTKDSLSWGARSVPVMRMESRRGERFEPVTYWVRIGDRLVRGNLEQGLARLRYGLAGQIADGLLFRVSSIDGDAPRAYAQHDAFVRALMQSLPQALARQYLGAVAAP